MSHRSRAPAAAPPETVGLSAERLGRLDDLLQTRYIDPGRFPKPRLPSGNPAAP